MKDTCAGCGAYLKLSDERYDNYGNWCVKCLGVVNKSLAYKRVEQAEKRLWEQTYLKPEYEDVASSS